MAPEIEILKAIVAVANGWILEFACLTTWLEFVALDETFFYQGRDYLQGLLARRVEASPERQRRIKLIQLLCRLADGKDHNTRYEEDGDITALESALPIFDALVENSELPAGDQVEDARRLLKTQSVLVCCRADDFDAAEEVFQRVWPAGSSQSAKDKKFCTKIKEAIKSRNPQHSLVQTRCSYEKFLSWMSEFLQLIVDDFKQPFLFKAAERVVRGRLGDCTEESEGNEAKSDTDSDVYETPSENEASPEEEEFVFKSSRLLRECFLVMAKEERSTAEWKDIASYDYQNLGTDLEQSREEKTSGATVRRSPRKHEQTSDKPTVRRSPRKTAQTTSEPVQDSIPQPDRSEQREKRKHTKKDGKSEPTERRIPRKIQPQTTSEPSTSESSFTSSAQDSQADRDDQGAEQSSRQSKSNSHGAAGMLDQPSTSGVRQKVRGHVKRRVLQDDDSDSEDAMENVVRGSKKRPRDKFAYDNGTKETWSSDEETFRAPVKKKYAYDYDSDTSDTSEGIRSALPCGAASLVVPPRPRQPLDITKKGYIRIRHKWDDKEVENLIAGVRKYGHGHWSEILDTYRFNNRTNVNLKDKWRQLVKSGVVKDV